MTAPAQRRYRWSSSGNAERVADRQHEVADLDAVGISHRNHWKRLFRLDLQDGQIELFVLEHQLARKLAAVSHCHFHFIGVANDVEIGDDEAFGIDEHARAERRLDPWRHDLTSEESLEERIAGERRLHFPGR